jgi:hypothetical protein
MTDWYLEGPAYGSCNCDYACPCQFESKPTYGHCRGFEAAEIEKGHFGDVSLNGLRFVILYAWPGPIYEGGGEVQAIVDERASGSQREALLTILYGGETDEAATHWWVFRTMSEKVHPPLYCPIEFVVDMDGRMAEVTIPGVMQSRAEPIRGPVSGEPHRVRIDLPNGIEFEIAEIGSGTTSAEGTIKLDLKNSYAQFNRLRHTGRGIVRDKRKRR